MAKDNDQASPEKTEIIPPDSPEHEPKIKPNRQGMVRGH